MARSFRITGRVALDPTLSGVLVARGGESGGFALFAPDGAVVFEIEELSIELFEPRTPPTLSELDQLTRSQRPIQRPMASARW